MKHNFPVTLALLALFLIAQVFGLITISQYIDINASAKTGLTQIHEEKYLIEPPGTDEPLSFLYIIIGVLIGTAILLVIIHFGKHKIWKAWYFLAIAIALVVAIHPYLLLLLAGLNASFIAILTCIIAALIALFKVFKFNPLFHNVTEVLVYSGIAALLVPILTFSAVVIVLILISVYDMIAVWKSKHMITLAKFQSSSNLFAGLMIPKGKPIAGKKIELSKTKKTSSAILGGGDIAFPLLFNGVILKYSANYLGSFIIIITTTIALALLFFLAKKDKFYPAMPFISAGCFIGYFISMVI